jgi:hypothetical protein
MWRGDVFELPTSEHLTGATGSSPLLDVPIEEEAVKLLPTPTEGDSTNSRSATSTRKGNFEPRTNLSDVAYEWSGGNTVQRSIAGKPSTGLRLSPSFVGWMMGTPSCGECGREWTDSDCPHSATAFTSTSDDSSEMRSWSCGGPMLEVALMREWAEEEP